MSPLMLTGGPLSIDDVTQVARTGRRVELGSEAAAAVTVARSIVDAAADGVDPVYGINTGFGSLSQHRVPPEETAEIQRNLLRSHAAGVGKPLEAELVRAMLLLLAASLSRGHSGVRVEVIEALLSLL
ncbi:MAG: aromatic amino acid lyase, partial [Phycisphaerales bacterium]|nr:aromatic amino acid lyase [Phycisphaerales bacterium]